jgi:hypothetical protein
MPWNSRGSVLLTVMIILVVFAVIGAAALKLSEKEAVSSNQRISYTALLLCADAAEKKLWAEYSLYNGNVPAVKPVVIPGSGLPDGGQGVQLSIAHYDADESVTQVIFDERSFKPVSRRATSGGLGEMDQTNSFRREMGGTPFLITAHCTDRKNRQYEVELLVRYGI